MASRRLRKDETPELRTGKLEESHEGHSLHSGADVINVTRGGTRSLKTDVWIWTNPEGQQMWWKKEEAARAAWNRITK